MCKSETVRRLSDINKRLKYKTDELKSLNASSPNPATIDLALARPTLNVVRGSLRGGAGAGLRPGK